MTTPAKIRLTGDDLLRLEGQYPDNRLELIEGELRIHPPNGWQHAATTSSVAFFLAQYQMQYKTGTGLAGATGFYTRGNPYTVRMSDLAFISFQRLPVDKITSDYGRIAPELVAEIIAPEDDAGEIEEKIQEWLNFGVRLLWVVYPKTRRVHVYQPGSKPDILNANDTITGGDILPGFSAKVKEFFEQ